MNALVRNLRLVDAIGILPAVILTMLFGMEFLDISIDLIHGLAIFAACSAYLLFSLVINNYFDRENDKNGGKIRKNPVAAGHLSAGTAFVEAVTLAAAGMIIVFLYSPVVILPYFIFIANGFLYSYKFKGIPLAGLVSHGIYFSALFAMPALALNFPIMIIAAGTILAFLVSTAMQLENEISDYSADKKAGVRTTTVRYGVNVSRWLYYFSNLACFCFIALLYTYMPDYKILLFTPLVFFSMVRLDVNKVGTNFEKLTMGYTGLALLAIILL